MCRKKEKVRSIKSKEVLGIIASKDKNRLLEDNNVILKVIKEQVLTNKAAKTFLTHKLIIERN